jgi:hypothetical protein
MAVTYGAELASNKTIKTCYTSGIIDLLNTAVNTFSFAYLLANPASGAFIWIDVDL